MRNVISLCSLLKVKGSERPWRGFFLWLFRRNGAIIARCLELQVRVWAHLRFGSLTVKIEADKACLSGWSE